MKIVILGGTGLIGSKVVNLLRAGGHEVVAASPSQGINSITGEGLTEALTGAQVVVDVTNSPSFEDKAVLEFFETSTRNVLAAEVKTGVGHHVASATQLERIRLFGCVCVVTVYEVPRVTASDRAWLSATTIVRAAPSVAWARL
jgi:nucleoside-diphosphate-sugar epimerase